MELFLVLVLICRAGVPFKTLKHTSAFCYQDTANKTGWTSAVGSLTEEETSLPPYVLHRFLLIILSLDSGSEEDENSAFHMLVLATGYSCIQCKYCTLDNLTDVISSTLSLTILTVRPYKISYCAK